MASWCGTRGAPAGRGRISGSSGGSSSSSSWSEVGSSTSSSTSSSSTSSSSSSSARSSSSSGGGSSSTHHHEQAVGAVGVAPRHLPPRRSPTGEQQGSLQGQFTAGVQWHASTGVQRLNVCYVPVAARLRGAAVRGPRKTKPQITTGSTAEIYLRNSHTRGWGGSLSNPVPWPPCRMPVPPAATKRQTARGRAVSSGMNTRTGEAPTAPSPAAAAPAPAPAAPAAAAVAGVRTLSPSGVFCAAHASFSACSCSVSSGAAGRTAAADSSQAHTGTAQHLLLQLEGLGAGGQRDALLLGPAQAVDRPTHRALGRRRGGGQQSASSSARSTSSASSTSARSTSTSSRIRRISSSHTFSSSVGASSSALV